MSAAACVMLRTRFLLTGTGGAGRIPLAIVERRPRTHSLMLGAVSPSFSRGALGFHAEHTISTCVWPDRGSRRGALSTTALHSTSSRVSAFSGTIAAREAGAVCSAPAPRACSRLMLVADDDG